MSNNETAAFVTELRKRAELTTSELAELVGPTVTAEDVERWETDGVPAKHSKALKAAADSLFQSTPSGHVVRTPTLRAKAFGANLRAIREDQHMTRVELAAVIGKGEVALMHYESGRNLINLVDAIDLARFLNVSLSHLTGELPHEEQLPEELRHSFNHLPDVDKQLVIEFAKSLEKRLMSS
jgi:transcriptional regulator with XRE-family HTH domain